MLACCEEILKKKRHLSSQSSGFNSVKSSSETCVAPPVSLKTGDDDPGNRPTDQEEMSPP